MNVVWDVRNVVWDDWEIVWDDRKVVWDHGKVVWDDRTVVWDDRKGVWLAGLLACWLSWLAGFPGLLAELKKIGCQLSGPNVVEK